MPLVANVAFHHLANAEKLCVDRWTAEGKVPTEIARLLHRDKSTIVRHLNGTASGTAGRKNSLGAKQDPAPSKTQPKTGADNCPKILPAIASYLHVPFR